jgi:uncharacterized protein DUF4190
MEPWQVGQRFPCARCNQEFIAGGPAQLGYPMPGVAQQQSNGMAIASLICGLLLCFWPASLCAVIFGIIGLNKSKNSQIGGRGMAIAGTILGSIGLLTIPILLVSILIPSIGVARDTANRIKSATNLRQIDLAIKNYANNNNGDYPQDLGTLYQDQNLDLHLFVCPGTGTTPPVSMTVDQAVQWVNMNSDYVYMGAGLKSPVMSGVLVMYEKDSDHANRGDNVLYGDGRVIFLPIPAVHQAIASANYYGNPH